MANENNTAKSQAVNAEFTNSEIVTTSLIPAGQATTSQLVLFSPENKERLIQAFVNMEVMNYEKGSEECKKLIKKHSKLNVKDKDDKTGYEAVKKAYTELVKIRTSTEAKRKELNKPYADIKKGIDDYAKENITNVLASEEARLKAEKDKYEKWEADEKAKKEAEEQALLEARVKELKESGLTFDGELYVIAEISLDVTTIKKMKGSDYEILLEKVKEAKKKIDDEATAKAEAAAAEAAAVKAQAEENERKAKELKDEKLEVRRERLEAIGFIDDIEKERFYIAGDGFFFELEYDLAANFSASDFKTYLENTELAIQEAKNKPQESEPKTSTIEPENVVSANKELNDWEALTCYLENFTGFVAPILKLGDANNILADFKNDMKLALYKAIDNIKSFTNE